MLGFAPDGRTPLPPRAIIDQSQIGTQLALVPFFLYPAVAYESELSTLRQNTKNRTTKVVRFALVVIRLGFGKINHFPKGYGILLGVIS